MSNTIFYHIYIPYPENYIHYVWPLWIDEQLGIIHQSGLADNSLVFVCITMPANEIVPFMNRTYENIVTNYISERYPFAKIIDVRDLSEPNIYEGQTLKQLYNRSLTNNEQLLYIHTKGMSKRIAPTVHDWRRYLQYFMVEKWRDCVDQLKSNDLVTVKSRSRANVWWANSQYIRTLKDPVESQYIFTENPNMWPGAADYRYAFEGWIYSNSPRICYIHDSGSVEHYQEFYPPNLYRL